MANGKSDFVRRSADLINWIDNQIGEPNLAHTPRTTTSATLCSLGRQHQRAIVRLVEEDLPGPAAALRRVLFESYVRAVWASDCASDAELDDALDDKWPTLNKLARAVESTPHLGSGALAAAMSSNAFNSFTHNGTEALARQFKADVIESGFTLKELEQMLLFADSVGLLVALQMAALTKNESLGRALLDRAAKH